MAFSEHLTPYPSLSQAIENIHLQDRSVLITGGGYGIGSDIARCFAERHVSGIILVGRTAARLEATASALSTLFPHIKIGFRVADISSKSDVQRLFDSLAEEPPNILINNAGYMSQPDSFVDADLDDWWKGFTINVLGTALVTQGFLRHRNARNADLKKISNQTAIVVTLNSPGAYSIHIPQLSSYSASKAALMRWNELVADDVPESEVRLVSVHPGAINTEMMVKSGVRDDFPVTESELAANFIVWVTSKEAEFLAGRFVWANWDIDELLKMKGEIIAKDLFKDLRTLRLRKYTSP
ncbi:NAD(P)-binding protein [Thozetella sp. PMI_491]|nr:NAD(P)-binding protein [Thozetella sp. PMI_491]